MRSDSNPVTRIGSHHSGSNGRVRIGDRPAAPSRRWALIVVAMLVAHAGLMTAAVVIAVRSPYQVIPDYYERAVNWDAERSAAHSHSASRAESGK